MQPCCMPPTDVHVAASVAACDVSLYLAPVGAPCNHGTAKLVPTDDDVQKQENKSP